MSKTDTPAKVASNDQLGLVPEHTAFEAAMTADGYTLDFLILEGGRRYAYMEAELALRGWEAAVAAERERCEKLCQQAMPQPVGNWNDAQIVEAFRAVLERIRSGA